MSDYNPERASLTDQAHQLIEEKIVMLILVPGELVSESILSNLIGIGTSPIREALKRLAREHLVEIIPRSGVVVAALNADKQRDVLETRRVLDCLIAKAAARRATIEERLAIVTLAREMDKTVVENDIKGFLQMGVAFHDLLAKAGRNVIAAETVASLFSVSRRFWYFHTGPQGNFSETAVLYGAIASAIAVGDERAASDASEHLIDFLLTFTLQSLPV
ncbi:GntR family transcriptional regulator [Glaciimonas sp. PCH181]|uniref:GntR family transcriptional regulator n=1 Tax=Glaciimonas sp. PCH181 TaxID=2133943 RepID=UPI000D3CB0AF|nr:GntR family transcriptional regulator [Glaciimonas sp. PCH181]PUA20286.1 GntR family transcriptional regulator [Glaciimonas sp. PCH181]